MSDISLEFEWRERLIASPVLGWPGLLAGGAPGAAIGAIIGDLIFFIRIMLK